jgi:hypothetical protein
VRRMYIKESGLLQSIFQTRGALISTPGIFAFLCDSAVIAFYSMFTAETQRNAEIPRKDFQTRALPRDPCFFEGVTNRFGNTDLTAD